MKVKLKIGRAGSDFTQNVGDEIEVGKDEGMKLIKLGHAVAVKQKAERATKKAESEQRA